MSRRLSTAAIIATGLFAAGALLLAPWVVMAGVAGVLFLLGTTRIIRYQRPTLILVFELVLLAGTKYRSRDVGATLSGIADAQVLLELAFYAAIAWIVFLTIVFPSRPVRRVAPTIAVGLVSYAGLAVLSTAWSPTPAITLVRSVQLAILVAAAICLFSRSDPATILSSLLIALVVHCVTFSALAIAVTGGRPYMETTNGENRFTWFALHPGVVATLSATAFVLLLAYLLSRAPRAPGARRFGYRGFASLAGIAFFGGLLLATRTRSDLLASIATVGVLLIRRARPRPMTLAIAVLGSVALGGFALTYLGVTDFFSRLLSNDSAVGAYLIRGESQARLLTLNSRTLLWNDMLPLVVARPVLGWGFESSRSILLDVFFWAASAHNALMQTLLDLGVVGAVLLMTLFGSCFFVGSSRRGDGDERAAFGRTAVFGLAVYLAIQSIGSESYAGTPGFPTLVAFLCMLAAADLRRRSRTLPVRVASFGRLLHGVQDWRADACAC
jgi:exopolysaccharide production protein ExoQ